MAISAPYGGAERHGLVYIHNGRPQGPDSAPSQVSSGAFSLINAAKSSALTDAAVVQVLQGRWASSYMPASFGYSMSGNTDIDQNGYPGTHTYMHTAASIAFLCIKANGGR